VTAWFLGKANAIYIFYLRTKCMQMHKQTHKQYFIVPVANSKKIGPYTIMNVEQHNHYNKVAKKIGKPQISYKELLTMAVFKTPSGFLGVQRNIL
jgi:hypothetical protein